MHAAIVQLSVFEDWPAHDDPEFAGAGFVHDLACSLVPVPQLTEQSLQKLQGVHCP